MYQRTLRRPPPIRDLTLYLLHAPERQGPALKGRVFATFRNAAGAMEAGIDAGGLFKELLTDVAKATFDPERGLFSPTPDGFVYPALQAPYLPDGLRMIEFAGLVVGKALYEGILLEANFASFFAAALLRHPVTLDDLPSLDKELHRSLLQIKRRGASH